MHDSSPLVDVELGGEAWPSCRIGGRMVFTDLCWVLSVLALHAFRENYLKIWVVAWLSPSAFETGRTFLPAEIAAPFDLVVVHATFVVPPGYSPGRSDIRRMRDLLLPVMVITPVLVGFAGAQSVVVARFRCPCEWRWRWVIAMVLLTASVALLRARRGRWHLSAGWWPHLPCLHLSWPSFYRWRPSWRLYLRPPRLLWVSASS